MSRPPSGAAWAGRPAASPSNGGPPQNSMLLNQPGPAVKLPYRIPPPLSSSSPMQSVVSPADPRKLHHHHQQQQQQQQQQQHQHQQQQQQQHQQQHQHQQQQQHQLQHQLQAHLSPSAPSPLHSLPATPIHHQQLQQPGLSAPQTPQTQSGPPPPTFVSIHAPIQQQRPVSNIVPLQYALPSAASTPTSSLPPPHQSQNPQLYSSRGLPPSFPSPAPLPNVDPSQAALLGQTPVSSIALTAQQRAATFLSLQAAQKSRPCDSCRRRKSRCFIPLNDDSCVLCRYKKLKCTFVEGPQPRRKRDISDSSGQTPASSSKSARLEETSPNMSTTAPSTDASQNSTVVSSSCTNTSTAATPFNIPSNSPPIRDVLPIEDYSTIQGHSLLKKSLGLQNPRGSTYVGSTSAFDYGFLSQLPFNRHREAQLSSAVSIRRVSPDAMFTIECDRTLDGYEDRLRTVDDIERIVAPHGQALIDLYFRIVHPSFPILHKKVFLEKYSRTHRELSPPLLAAVYCLALNWWSYDPLLTQQTKPDADKLAKLAHRTFTDLLMLPKISTVQAGLLLLQRRQDSAGDWPLCTHVVALSEELGLGLDCEHWRIPRWERGLRRRLAWAVWLQDKWHALTQSRPSHMDKQNWLVRNLSADDFPETVADECDQDGSAEVENGRRLFQEMVSLSDILHEVLITFFTVAAETNLRDIKDVLEKAKPIQIKLKDWHQALPESLRVNSQVKTRKLSSSGSLHLAYFVTEITLHRRIIHAIRPDTDPEIVSVVRTAARTRLQAAMELVKNLRPEHIQAFWYSASATNFAIVGTFAALLLSTSKDANERQYYKTCLDEYRWNLRVMSRGFDQVAQALRKLDLAITQIPVFEIDKRGILSTEESGKKEDIEDDDDDDEDEERNSRERSADSSSGNRAARKSKSRIGTTTTVDTEDEVAFDESDRPFEEDVLYTLPDMHEIRYWNEVAYDVNHDGSSSASLTNSSSTSLADRSAAAETAGASHTGTTSMAEKSDSPSSVVINSAVETSVESEPTAILRGESSAVSSPEPPTQPAESTIPSSDSSSSKVSVPGMSATGISTVPSTSNPVVPSTSLQSSSEWIYSWPTEAPPARSYQTSPNTQK
ncbi:fungal-specific transcription factor domain-containing protein [Lipomyces oligophaga]|uniref:fungal-specific transcription factor domain-containing protein n=1 Tax=Lipomyces oligophaga TaxID=45792 RepID=UPI0034CD9AE1